jgi:RNA polymerase sigma-70 factor (ECF subfamily)
MGSRIESRDLQGHLPYLTAYAMRQLRDRELAQDLVQDTLLAALSSVAGFAGRSSLRTWLTGILKHKIMDAYRDRARAPASLDELRDAGDEPEAAAALEQAGCAESDPAIQLEHKRFWDAFVREIGRMPARTAEAFVLSEFTGLETGEVCEKLGVTPGALWVMRFRARDTLRRALAPALAC